MVSQTRITSIEYCDHKFLIMDSPKEDTIDEYAKFLQINGVKYVIRLCEPTYPTETFKEAGIQIVEMPIQDGHAPSTSTVKSWIKLLAEIKETGPIAVHCAAGLGRAPVMVAVAFIEDGMKPLDAIEFIREKRPCSFNNRQIDYLDKYQRISKKNFTKRISQVFSSHRKSVTIK